MNFSINISSLNPNTLTEIDREYEFYSKRESTVTKEEIIENLKDRYMYTELQELAKRKIKELLVVEL
jgi:hypothetical protein